MRRPYLILLGGVLLATFVGLAYAGPAELKWGPVPPPREEYVLPPRDAMRVSMEILVNGQPVRLIPHAGRLYLPVPRLGAEYEIRVNNHGPRRITAIVSVDGLSVIKGQPASEQHPGYLVSPGDHIVIKGWRRDRNTVAAFTFEEREKSHAYRMGHPENIGVIGLVAFEEWTRRPIPLEERKTDAAARLREAPGGLGGTGTGYGRDVESPVYTVPFVRSPNKRTITIYYDTVDALRRAGVPVDTWPPVPFPGDREPSPRPLSRRTP